MFGELHSPAGGDDIISHYYGINNDTYMYNNIYPNIDSDNILFLPSPSGKNYNSYPVQEYLYKSVKLSHYEIFTSLQYPLFLLS